MFLVTGGVNISKDIKLNKKERAFMNQLAIGTEKEIIRNRFGGNEVELCPEAVAVYDYLIGAEHCLNQSYSEEGMKQFYLARDIFLKNWSDAYMILLD